MSTTKLNSNKSMTYSFVAEVMYRVYTALLVKDSTVRNYNKLINYNSSSYKVCSVHQVVWYSERSLPVSTGR